ncbi:MAG: hypothetical protein NVS2B14_02200 [Chamaesiphon sp.]
MKQDRGIGIRMDALQKQIAILSHKIDGLYQMVEVLSYKVSEALPEKQSTPVQASDRFASSVVNVRQYAHHKHTSVDSMMEHKDVLADRNGFETNTHQNNEKELSPQIQVQRLTAQLTAAYNRIAALEEQLLARRLH